VKPNECRTTPHASRYGRGSDSHPGNSQNIKTGREFATYDQEYARYGNTYSIEKWESVFWRRIRDLLHLTPSSRYLDIGAGASAYTVVGGAETAGKVVVSNVSRIGMGKARQRAESVLRPSALSKCDFVVCDATALPFKDCSFDAISMIAVLEHIEQDGVALHEIARILSQGGRIYLVVPNACRNIQPALWFPYAIHDMIVGHFRHYRLSLLAKKVSQAGLLLEKAFYSAHMFKILQFVAAKVWKSSEKLWWILEELDGRMTGVPFGLQLHLVAAQRREARDRSGR